MSGELRTGCCLISVLLSVGACGESGPDEICSDGQYGPRDLVVKLAAGESRWIDTLGPAAVVYSDPRDYQKLLVDTYCDGGDCSAAYLLLDSRRVDVPGHAEFTLGYQHDQRVLSASNGGTSAITVHIVLSGSYHSCYL
jgi:hypothetical protein